MSNKPNELIVLLYKDGRHPVGTEGVYFSGLTTRTWLRKRVNSKGFINWRNKYDEALIITRAKWDTIWDAQDFDKIPGRIPIGCLQYNR